MNVGEKAKSLAIDAREFIGEKADQALDSPKMDLAFAVGNFIGSNVAAVIAVETASQPTPNDKVTALAVGVSAISAVVSGVHWSNYMHEQNYPDQRD